MTQLLDITHTIVAIVFAIIGILSIWIKLSNDLKAMQKEIALITKQLSTKAEDEIVVKLAGLVAELERTMILHHTDAKIHRNPDSEKRMDDLVRSVETLAEENRIAHEKIMISIAALEAARRAIS